MDAAEADVLAFMTFPKELRWETRNEADRSWNLSDWLHSFTSPAPSSTHETKEKQLPSVCHSVIDLQAAVNRIIDEHNEEPKPFVWNADSDELIAAHKDFTPPLKELLAYYQSLEDVRVRYEEIRRFLAGVPANDHADLAIDVTGPTSSAIPHPASYQRLASS